MKIALITVHKVTNFGALMQAYASKLILSRFGKVSVIDYKNPFLDRQMHLFRFKLSVHGFKMLAHDILNFGNRWKYRKKFKDFIRTNYNLTEPYTSKKLQNQEIALEYDVFVCGSDQIWNPKIINPNSQIDPNYFLAFAPPSSCKISFASSMGNYSFNPQEAEYLRSLLKDFHAISVREKEGRDFLENLFSEKTIHHVLDPTLLLSKEDWLETLDTRDPVVNTPYILVYSVPRTALLRKAVTYYSTKFGMKVVAIDKMLFPMKSVDIHHSKGGPEDFIRLFANASFVITDSFHGTCFSVNFEKPFVCIPATPKANRQEGLLGSLGLMQHIVYEESSFKNIPKTLDYQNAKARMQELRKQSLSFLSTALNSIP